MPEDREKNRKKTAAGKKAEEYIYTPGAVFRGDILDTHDEDDMSDRRKKRLEAGKKKKERSLAAKKRIRRGLILAAAVLGVFLLFAATVGKDVMKLVSLETEKREKEQQLVDLQAEEQKNRDILEQVNSDEYVEQEARSQFNMIKEGEILYRINSDKASSPEETSPSDGTQDPGAATPEGNDDTGDESLKKAFGTFDGAGSFSAGSTAEEN